MQTIFQTWHNTCGVFSLKTLCFSIFFSSSVILAWAYHLVGMLIDTWPSVCLNIHIYEYFLSCLLDINCLPPDAVGAFIHQNLRQFHKCFYEFKKTLPFKFIPLLSSVIWFTSTHTEGCKSMFFVFLWEAFQKFDSSVDAQAMKCVTRWAHGNMFNFFTTV